jgi:hypothetical protein
MLYFNQKEYYPTEDDLEQQAAVLNFKKNLTKLGGLTRTVMVWGINQISSYFFDGSTWYATSPMLQPAGNVSNPSISPLIFFGPSGEDTEQVVSVTD